MQKIILIVLFFFLSTLVFGQTKVANSEILSNDVIAKIFTENFNKKHGIIYPISWVYKSIDKSGEFFIVLTESNDNNANAYKDQKNYNIKAYNFHQDKIGLIKKWEINDFVAYQANYPDLKEREISIWFWTKYSTFVDIDNDGLIDPIIIYGTSGMNYTGDGRIKILIYYKGKKVVIRHQNGVLDDERNTQVDKEFYSLPQKIQDKVKLIMEKISKDDDVIFPSGWQDNMKKKKLKFDER